jgi:mono/diheme cytochrome c family protein
VAGLLFLLILAGPAHAADIRFLREGQAMKQVDIPALLRACTVKTIEVDDPNYGARKRYLACPLSDVLAFGFGEPVATLGSADVFVRAWDGYDKPTSAARLAEDGAWLAVGDADLSQGENLRWAPLGSKAIDPGPAYIVWSKRGQRDETVYPWIWEIAEFEVVEFQKKYPHVIPGGVARSAPAWQGFEIFRGECIACHAINREGGTTGPDLNVPRSIVEYRPVEQIKAYIKDPKTFRYGNMPAHPDLSDADLNALVAYFRIMSRRKHDPAQAQ